MTGLPIGFGIRLSDSVRVGGRAQVLTGGSPLRVLFPGAAARDLLATGGFSVSDGPSAELAEKLLAFGMADPAAASLAAPADKAVTFVVPVRDRPDHLRRLLQSIGPGQRVVVVDDASLSPQPIADAASAYAAEYVPLAVNAGPAAARNAGLARVRTPYVAFVDSDMVLDPGTVPALLRHFADPGVALVAPRILGWNPGNDAGWICRYEDSRSSLDLGRRPALVHPRGTVSWLPAACLVGRVEALGGGFSAELRVAEDVDLVWNLVREGKRVRYDASVAARHEHRRELVPWLARKMFYGTGAHELSRRHGSNVAPAVLAPWSVAFLLALLAQRRWSLPVAAALAAATALRLARRLRRSPKPLRLASVLVGQGVLAALGQGSALLLRHWWPLTAVGCLFSGRLRRAALLAGMVDAAVEYRRTGAELDPVRFAVARRLDDLAYGAGVWLGAVRGHSAGALLPEITGLRTTRRRRRP
ncbi:mycofactocin biosynthesis glycosyltransferase MftF [Arthrobacter sp. zg-Y859]|uniref:Mycofactocin biosynthesis glycosyltransferase MftF n=1 Tax=Arthrobacter jinronghuae TaxID=2964609 RepID=A0ABT1NTH4_9MICC|nr:mycofactocin biosynthesis glycosyltransferase MftF [Arthrobacter jinronghuae]MCQ1950039.1 mycofactocin biosynthesis glycosyltransferase MftF [Arthrobacter jinronghuae]UWX80179.1 mycofactocin biosynthesis glycosyltransferase MftF [Arthrobacter jinronghuae]